jgi:adenosylcobinamide hydrolase
MMLMIYRLSTGDGVHRYNKSIVIPFEGKRRALSTSPLNGGYREDLNAVFNNDGNPGAGMAYKLRAPTYKEHMRIIASELGLNPDKAAGISTAASMDNE